MLRDPRPICINPLAPNLGGRIEDLGTPQTPAGSLLRLRSPVPPLSKGDSRGFKVGDTTKPPRQEASCISSLLKVR